MGTGSILLCLTLSGNTRKKPGGSCVCLSSLEKQQVFVRPGFIERIVHIPFQGHAVKGLASPDSSMLLVAVPCAMSFRTLCLPCGVCRSRYALRIFRPTIPAHTPVPAPSAWLFLQIWLSCAREISSSISYTASFLGTICLEVPSPIPTVFFLHLTVALQRRTVYDFLIGRHLLPDRELFGKENTLCSLGISCKP